jgi:hypothetical protein
MVMSDDLGHRALESKRRLAAMTPESSLQAAALVRSVEPRLLTDQQRRVAEDMAQRFEEHAFAHTQSSSS